jgi:hypothetical protein
MHPRPHGALRPEEFEELKVRTVHRDWNVRAQQLKNCAVIIHLPVLYSAKSDFIISAPRLAVAFSAKNILIYINMF